MFYTRIYLQWTEAWRQFGWLDGTASEDELKISLCARLLKTDASIKKIQARLPSGVEIAAVNAWPDRYLAWIEVCCANKDVLWSLVRSGPFAVRKYARRRIYERPKMVFVTGGRFSE